jgi:hypothetical protein
MDGIVIALIGAGASVVVGVLSLVGVVVSNNKANQKINMEIQHKLETQQAVTDTKIDELTREVREHNGFARRMPVVEQQIKTMGEDIKTLKGYHKPKEC